MLFVGGMCVVSYSAVMATLRGAYHPLYLQDILDDGDAADQENVGRSKRGTFWNCCGLDFGCCGGLRSRGATDGLLGYPSESKKFVRVSFDGLGNGEEGEVLSRAAVLQELADGGEDLCGGRVVGSAVRAGRLQLSDSETVFSSDFENRCTVPQYNTFDAPYVRCEC